MKLHIVINREDSGCQERDTFLRSKQDIEFEFEGNYLQRSVARVIEQFGLEGTFKGYLVQAPAMSRGIFNWIRLLRAPFSLTFECFQGSGIHHFIVGFTIFIVLARHQVLVDHRGNGLHSPQHHTFRCGKQRIWGYFCFLSYYQIHQTFTACFTATITKVIAEKNCWEKQLRSSTLLISLWLYLTLQRTLLKSQSSASGCISIQLRKAGRVRLGGGLWSILIYHLLYLLLPLP